MHEIETANVKKAQARLDAAHGKNEQADARTGLAVAQKALDSAQGNAPDGERRYRRNAETDPEPTIQMEPDASQEEMPKRQDW